MFCRGCEYRLDNLDSRRCPECGEPFDPDDPTTFWQRKEDAQGERRFAVMFVTGFMLTLGLPILALIGLAFAALAALANAIAEHLLP